MKTHWYLILLALADRARHGADIRRRVRDTDGTLELYPAMLYGSLEDLEERGWIQEAVDGRGRPAGANERRRYYKLTRSGRTALAGETGRLETLTRLARSALSGGRTS